MSHSLNAGIRLDATRWKTSPAWSLRCQRAGEGSTHGWSISAAGGALLVTENRPPHEAAVWMRIESPVKTDWAEAMTVRLGQDQEIGIQFPRGCPDDLLLAGTIGIDLISMIVDPSLLASAYD